MPRIQPARLSLPGARPSGGRPHRPGGRPTVPEAAPTVREAAPTVGTRHRAAQAFGLLASWASTASHAAESATSSPMAFSSLHMRPRGRTETRVETVVFPRTRTHEPTKGGVQ